MEATRIPYRITRRQVVASAVAVLINGAVFIALTSPSVDVGAATSDDALEVLLIRPERVVVPEPSPPTPRTRPHSSLTKPTPAPVAAAAGPPTETAAAVGLEDLEPKDVSVTAFMRTCRDQLHEEIPLSDGATTVALRVFVLPDGKIAQGTVTTSSGDEALDRAAFRCAQAFANLEPAIANGDPVGSWQTIVTRW